jgi:nucleoside-diphosphate-sugar epimerase
LKKVIVVAGGTGNLGERIVRSLILNGAEVRMIVRSDSNQEKINKLQKFGAKIVKVKSWNLEELSKACLGAECVVSALSGLREVIIDSQITLLDAAIAAGVPRFIPSDYSIDFTKFPAGLNRNLDWRREFHQYLDKSNIAATTIFNGAFAELLTDQMPLIWFKFKRVLYWGNANQKMDFTTMDDTAAFTAKAALDPSTPRYLRIAGDQISPLEIRTVTTEVTGKKYSLFRAGGLGLLSMIIKIARNISSGENEVYPAWQGMQYMRNMADGRALLNPLDNNRYPGLHWTTVKKFLRSNIARK